MRSLTCSAITYPIGESQEFQVPILLLDRQIPRVEVFEEAKEHWEANIDNLNVSGLTLEHLGSSSHIVKAQVDHMASGRRYLAAEHGLEVLASHAQALVRVHWRSFH